MEVKDVAQLLSSLFKNNSEEKHWEHILENTAEDIYNQFETIEEGNWTDDGKYSFLEDCIIKHIPTETFWSIGQSRSGSYYSDYYYGDIGFGQVEKKTKTIEYWADVK